MTPQKREKEFHVSQSSMLFLKSWRRLLEPFFTAKFFLDGH
jgi:hypothetical protein